MKRPEDICPDFPRWPESWMGTKEDVPFGQSLVDSMRPFVEDLIANGLSDKTIRRHMDNLWLLGGEIIRDVSMADGTPNTTRSSPAEILRESVSPDGGLFCRHLYSDSDKKAYNATCRKLHRFLEKHRGMTNNGMRDTGMLPYQILMQPLSTMESP